jgi:hypothetical protein
MDRPSKWSARAEAFINEVEAQSGKGISVEDAGALTATTRQIIVLLAG